MRTLGLIVAAVTGLTHQSGAQESRSRESTTAIHEALSPFGALPDSGAIAKILENAAVSNEYPKTAYDRVLLARAWRRAAELDLAQKSLEDVSPDSDASDLAAYERARILLESSHERDNDSGTRSYWSACASQDDRVREEMFGDLLSVSTPGERDAWKAVSSGGATCEWLRIFWEQRAVRMAVPIPRRLSLHFQRMARAREHYHLAHPRIEADMASDHGRPAGLAVDDRGLLYIRMGEPHYSQGCPEDVVVPPDTTFTNRLGVCWVYARPPVFRIYYLTTRDRFGWNLPDNDFRIQESFGQQARPGTLLFQKYVMNSDLSRSAKQQLIRMGDSQARAFVRDTLEQAMDRVERRRAEQAIALAARRNTEVAFEEIPDAPDLLPTLDLWFETLRFLNPSEGRWQVWFLGAVPSDHLSRVDREAGGATFDVAGRVAVVASERMQIEEIASRSIPNEAAPPGAGVVLRAVISERPGRMPYTFVVQDLNAPGTGAWIHDTINVPAIGGLPQLSDIAVAQAEGGTWTRDGETFLQVSPAHVTNPDGSIHTYFEVYGVRPGTRYEVEFRLTETDAAERIWRLGPDDLAFRLRFTSEMPGDVGRHHLRLDLGDTEPGAYVLAVRIQDEDSKAYSLPSVTDVLVEER